MAAVLNAHQLLSENYNPSKVVSLQPATLTAAHAVFKRFRLS